MGIQLQIKGFKPSVDNLWDSLQVRTFCLAAVERIGGEGAWNILSDPLRRAVIAQEAFSVVRSSWRGEEGEQGVPSKAMNALLHDMERLLGLEE
jgi:hypothetical protein